MLKLLFEYLVVFISYTHLLCIELSFKNLEFEKTIKILSINVATYNR